MDSDGASVQYNRWNEDNINLNVPASPSGVMGVVYRLCTGTVGIAVKVIGALAALVSVYIIGYITGYYVHKC